MKFWWQFLIVIAIVLSWDCLRLFLEARVDRIGNQLYDTPVMFFSADDGLTEHADSLLRRIAYVKHLTVIKGEESSDTLISKYGLQQARDILDDVNLPDILRLNLEPDDYTEGSIRELTTQADTLGIPLEYDFNRWQSLRTAYDDAIVIRGTVDIVLAFVLFLVVGSMGTWSETRNNLFWKVYRRAGGDEGKRLKNFIRNYLALVFLPVIFSAVFVFLVRKYVLQSPWQELDLAGLQGIGLLLGTLVTALSMRSEES